MQAAADGKESKEPQVVACEPLIHQPNASAEHEVEKSECANERVNVNAYESSTNTNI